MQRGRGLPGSGGSWGTLALVSVSRSTGPARWAYAYLDVWGRGVRVVVSSGESPLRLRWVGLWQLHQGLGTRGLDQAAARRTGRALALQRLALGNGRTPGG